MVLWEIDIKMRLGMQEINGGASVKDKRERELGEMMRVFRLQCRLNNLEKEMGNKETWVERASDWSAVLKKSQPGSLTVLSQGWPSIKNKQNGKKKKKERNLHGQIKLLINLKNNKQNVIYTKQNVIQS